MYCCTSKRANDTVHVYEEVYLDHLGFRGEVYIIFFSNLAFVNRRITFVYIITHLLVINGYKSKVITEKQEKQLLNNVVTT